MLDQHYVDSLLVGPAREEFWKEFYGAAALKASYYLVPDLTMRERFALRDQIVEKSWEEPLDIPPTPYDKMEIHSWGWKSHKRAWQDPVPYDGPKWTTAYWMDSDACTKLWFFWKNLSQGVLRGLVEGPNGPLDHDLIMRRSTYSIKNSVWSRFAPFDHVWAYYSTKAAASYEKSLLDEVLAEGGKLKKGECYLGDHRRCSEYEGWYPGDPLLECNYEVHLAALQKYLCKKGLECPRKKEGK